MKKFYVLSVASLFFVGFGYAQAITWVGGSSGAWGTPGNWTGGVVPKAGDSVVFNSSASVNLDIEAISIKSLTITSSSTVRLITTAVSSNSVTVDNTAYPALTIDAGSRLEDSARAHEEFVFLMGDNASAEISGAWSFSADDLSFGATLILPFDGGLSGKVNVNNGGSIIIGDNAGSPLNETEAGYLNFKAGSLLHFAGSAVSIPHAIYNETSTILITGLKSTGIGIDEDVAIGNFIYNCPEQSGDNLFDVSVDDFHVKGDMRISGTNGHKLVLVGNGGVVLTNINIFIDKNLIVEGNSAVEISDAPAGKIVKLTVQGNAEIGGNSFSLQGFNNGESAPTTLVIKGNLLHTAGIFGAGSPSTSESINLFVVEMNSINAQTISSYNGSIDNTANQVTLRINNSSATGVTLASPLAVGRLSFNSGLGGRLTTTATNVLTINNVSGSSLVVENNADFTGFVDGPVRRKTITADPLVFPTGNGTVYRPATVIPAAADANPTTYEATYFNAPHPDRNQTLAPILGVSDTEYWEVHREGAGVDAQVQLTLNGVLNGAVPTDSIVVAKFDGGNWMNSQGAEGNALIATSTNGTVTSGILTSFSFFTFGYTTDGALPTTLLSFTARKTAGNEAAINWKVTDNSAPERFEVARSSDGVNFSVIGTEAGVERKFSYDFTDAHLLSGNNYYRLRMIDKDGSVTFSNIIVVINGIKGVLISGLMPTIVNTQTRLSVSASLNGKMQLVITDASGRVIQQQVAQINMGSQNILLDATRLKAGAYQVTGYMNGEKTSTFRFIKR